MPGEMRRTSLALVASIAAVACSSFSAAQTSGWTGNVNFNAFYAFNQNDQVQWFLDARAEQRLLAGSLFEYNLLYSLARQRNNSTGDWQPTEDRWRLNSRYDAPTDGFRFGTISVLVERNRMIDLAYRSITSAGLGYFALRSQGVRDSGRVANPGDFQLRANVGLSLLDEEYDVANTRKTEWGTQVNTFYQSLLKNGWEINHVLSFTPSLNNFSDYVLFSNLNLLVPINVRTRLAFNFIYDRTSVVPVGRRSDNYRYGINLNYRF